MTRILVYELVSAGGLGPHDGELLAAGLAMRDAILKDLLRVHGIVPACTVSALPGAGMPPCAFARSAVPECAHPGETPPAFVHRMAARHDLCWIVAPETDHMLLRLHEAVGAERWIGCSAAAIRVASSKSATTRVLESRGVATPRSLEGATRRWIVKPDDGAGALDARVHDCKGAAECDLEERERAGRRATLEPFVEGEALSVSMLAGGDAPPVTAFNRQRIEIDAAGLVHDRGVLIDAIDPRRDPRASRLHALARDVVRALHGLRGFVGIDLVWHAQRGPVVVEVNPRVTCAYVGLSDKLGRNLAAEILALHDAREASHGGVA
jgi:predicted ATP-grasp superfamily ATP-dependent carboligase